MREPRRRLSLLTRTATFLALLSALALYDEGTPLAFNYVIDINGTYWGIQDDDSPRVDTGSIRATQVSPGGPARAYSTGINGFGGIRVLVETTPAPYLNGELMRGFGLRFDGVNRFRSTQSLDMGGVTISRSVYINTNANWGRWLDTFTNTTKSAHHHPRGLRRAVGPGHDRSKFERDRRHVQRRRDCDAGGLVGRGATPLQGATLVGGPQVTVLGTPGPFPGAMTFAANWLYDTVHTPLAYSGHERNFQAYVNSLTLPPRTSRSLLHFVVIGRRVDEATSAAERAAVEATATNLASNPPIGDLSAAEICSIANFDIAAMSIPGFMHASCARKDSRGVAAAGAPQKKGKTAIKYNVVEKTIGQLRADMEAGVVTSEEITRAYLDRIEHYDLGQLGFHAYEIVASNAIAQAKAADRARRRGAAGPLLGIPLAIKNNYDTFDMPTTNGSFTFAGFQPARDAFQVARLREAGAVIIGKAALEEYATFGHWSNDAWGQVWSVFNPSRSPLASSGGSASAVAGSMAGRRDGIADRRFALRSGQRAEPGHAARYRRPRKRHRHPAAGVDDRLRWRDHAIGLRSRRHPERGDGHRSRGSGNARAARRRGPRRLALRAGHRGAARQADRLRGFGLGRRVRPGRASVRHQWHDRRDADRPPVHRAGRRAPSSGWVSSPRHRRPMRHRRRRRRFRQPGPRRGMAAIHRQPSGAARAGLSDLHGGGRRLLAEEGAVRQGRSGCLRRAEARLTPAEIQEHRDYRQITRPAGVKQWMDEANVDAVVYPGLLSDTSLNDGGGGGSGKAAFGRRDTPSAGNGVPTIAVPAGMNDRGQPVNIQFMGRAWDDARLVGLPTHSNITRRSRAAGISADDGAAAAARQPEELVGCSDRTRPLVASAPPGAITRRALDGHDRARRRRDDAAVRRGEGGAAVTECSPPRWPQAAAGSGSAWRSARRQHASSGWSPRGRRRSRPLARPWARLAGWRCSRP